jgi:hypothetical protein
MQSHLVLFRDGRSEHEEEVGRSIAQENEIIGVFQQCDAT